MDQLDPTPTPFSGLNRREALKLGLAVAAGSALGTVVPPVLADDEAPVPFAQTDVEAQVALPSLAVVALNRLAFGPRPGDAATSIDAFNALGADEATRLQVFVDRQLDPLGIDDSECNSRLAGAAGVLPSLGQSLPQMWANYYTASNADRSRPARDVRVATLLRAMYSKRQLYEVLVDFWHNHFSIFAWDFAYAGATWAHYDRDVIRANALGNFYTMLEAVAKSPAMLYYLDNYISRDDGPNENWARELFELHTFGAENYLGVVSDPSTIPDWNGVPSVPGIPKGYIDKDVYGATSSFTGWRVNNGSTGTAGNDGTFQFYSTWHWPYGPVILRVQFPDFEFADAGQRVLRLLADHPGTAQYVCRKLCRRLVGDNPPQSLVDAAATQFYYLRNDPNQLREVVRTIVMSNEFRTTWGQKIKRPHEITYTALRAVNANIIPDSGGLSGFWGSFDQMGQQLFGRRSPDGYPDVRDGWTNTTSMLYRWRLVNSLLENSFYSATNANGIQVDVNAIGTGGANTPNTIADFWINRVLGRAMDDVTHRAEIVRMLQGWDTGNSSTSVRPVYQPTQVMAQIDINNRLRRMVAVILMSPESQWR